VRLDVRWDEEGSVHTRILWGKHKVHLCEPPTDSVIWKLLLKLNAKTGCDAVEQARQEWWSRPVVVVEALIRELRGVSQEDLNDLLFELRGETVGEWAVQKLVQLRKVVIVDGMIRPAR
jgi:hypothetical protein